MVEMDYTRLFSKRAQGMKASEIRELLKITQNKEIISFAGGLPSPEAFPIEDVKNICNKVLDEDGASALQYCATEGVTKLREVIAQRMNNQGMDVTYKNILITTGAQQGLDLIGKTFLNTGDIVIVGAPTYLGGTNAFNSYRAKMESIPLDNEGMNPDLLEKKLNKLNLHGSNPKLLYIIPSFQNPSGVTLTQSRRERIVDIAHEYDVLIIEDNPYSKLRYDGEENSTIYSMDEENSTIYLGTFSKVLSPGLRIAWTVAPQQLMNKLIITKQASDLCSNTFGQYVAYEYLAQGLIDIHIEKIKNLYRKKRDTMLAALDKYFPQGATWTKPEGGMFIWVTLPEYIDTGHMIERAIENKVAYVIGAAFHADRSGKNCMRLNYTYASLDKIDEGIRKLAMTIENEMEMHKKKDESPYKPDDDGLITGV